MAGQINENTPSAPPPADAADDLARLIPRLQQLARAEPAIKARLQQYGVDVVPVDFYSTIPSVADIESSFEYAASAAAPYLSPQVFDPQRLQQVLRDIAVHADEFNPPEDGDELAPRGFFWKNRQFGWADAMAYYCFIRHYRPATIVEVGGGFSSLVALEALRANGGGRLVCIDPYPRPFLTGRPGIEVVTAAAQTLPVAAFDGWLQADGGFLFIDSTHTVKTGSDCLHLYLRVLPFLARRALVHVHDIFLPFGLPRHWLLEKQIFWTEQYLVLALLVGNSRLRVLYGSAYHAHYHAEALRHMMCGRPVGHGGSLWMEYHPR